MMKQAIALYLSSALIAGFASADQSDAEDIAEHNQNATGPGLLGSPNKTSGTQWQLESGADKSNVSIKLSPKNSWMNASLLLKAPLDKTSDFSDFNQSNKLVKDASATFSISYIDLDVSGLSATQQLLLTDACNTDISQFEGFESNKHCTNLEETTEAYTGNDEGVLAAIEQYNSWKKKPYFVYGASIEVGKDRFKYFLNDSTQTEERSETAWAVGLSSTINVPNTVSVTLEGKYQELYKSADTITRCPTGALTATVDCLSSSKQAPTHTERIVTSIESRFITDSIPYLKGIAPVVSYNDDSHKATLDVPFFLLSGKDNTYNGGVTGSWNNTSHEWEYSVFVGSKFPAF